MTPDVSVVMAVYNGEAQLAPTIDSVLDQGGIDLEIIVVDDGSTDSTPVIVERFAARDRRVRPVHLTKVGLTRALIAGCALARGALIARQDCGDVSLPGRLARQTRVLAAHPQVVMCAVGARFIGPRGERLYEVARTTAELQAGLSADRRAICGPSHHGATMFRRSAYEAVGGYRAAFDVAQDIDLWFRLAEAGEMIALPEILYSASIWNGAISQARRAEQMRAGDVIVACAAARRSGASDAAILSDWLAECRRPKLRRDLRREASAFNYFIGSLLRERDAEGAASYFRNACRLTPWRAKIWLRLAEAEIARVARRASRLKSA